MPGRALLCSAAVFAALTSSAAADEPVMLRCGRQYQAERSAGTLNGLDWDRYRAACAARLKGAAAPEPVLGAANVAPPPSAPPSGPAPVASASIAPVPSVRPGGEAQGGGTAAMHLRQAQCGAEWRAQKAALVAQTPGLTWPHYWSLCNARLKASGR